MSVTLTNTSDILTLGTASTNSAKCTIAGSVVSIISAATAGWLWRSVIPVGPRLSNTVTITVTNTGVASIQLYIATVMINAAGAGVGTTVSAPATIPAGASYTWTLASAAAPSATLLRAEIWLATTAGAGWKFSLDTVTSAASVTVDEMLGATVERDLPAEASGSGVARTAVISRGPAGIQKARVVYLCANFGSALDVDAIHQFVPAVVVSDAGAISGMAYIATGKLALAAEKAVPGRASRWLATVEGVLT
jgi:hypothetical protein